MTAAGTGILRASASISAWNLLSRLSGFVRVVAVAGALGATYLGNTYQSANLVSNLLFELLAAGILSSVLVPAFVEVLEREGGGRTELGRLAGAILGVLLAVLVPVVVAGAVAAEPLMRFLTLAVRDDAVRREVVALGAFWLWFFLPQVLLYAVGTVVTGALHAQHRFVAAAAAPVANNLAVVATMLVFRAVHDGAPTLDLGSSEKLVLALGTTGGVAAMTAVPVIAAARAGVRIRPRWEPRHPAIVSMRRKGAWAAVHLGLTQALLAAVLVLANRVEGGVVAYQVAFVFFLLPYALAAQPVLTALYPRLVADALRGAWDAFAARCGGGVRVVAFVVLPASALLAAGAAPAVRAVATGALGDDAPLVARTVTSFAVGAIGYAGFQLLTRASYAAGDARTPTLVNLAVAVAGTALMLTWSSAAEGDDRVVVLGWAHSIVQVGGAALLLVALRRRVGRPFGVCRALVSGTVAAVAAGVATRVVADTFDVEGRADAVAGGAAGAAAGVAVYLAIQAALGAPEVRAALRRWRGRSAPA